MIFLWDTSTTNLLRTTNNGLKNTSILFTILYLYKLALLMVSPSLVNTSVNTEFMKPCAISIANPRIWDPSSRTSPSSSTEISSALTWKKQSTKSEENSVKSIIFPRKALLSSLLQEMNRKKLSSAWRMSAKVSRNSFLNTLLPLHYLPRLLLLIIT